MSDMRKSNTGFTVIEVLIVVAVAGIILLLILLAIPALQRSGHNSRRGQDVQTVLQAVSSYELKHSGTVPDQVDLRSFLDDYEDLSYYTTDRITVTFYPPSNVILYRTNNTTVDTMEIVNHAKCSGGGGPGGFTNAGAGYSDVAALYTIEASNGSTHKCQQL